MNAYFQTDSINSKLLDEKQLMFVAQVELILKEHAPQFDPADTILTCEGKELIIIIRNKELSNISLVISYSTVSIGTGWAQVTNLEYHDDLDNGFSEKYFFELDYNNLNDRNDAALNFIRQQLEREIYLKVTYLSSMATKINYLIKAKDNNYQEIGRVKLCKLRCIDLFRKKETKTYKTTILEKNDLLNKIKRADKISNLSQFK
jgi:hypothetical protein